MQSRLVELQQQNSSIGRVKTLMSELQDEIHLDLEEEKRAIDEMKKRSDIKTKIEALLKLGDEAAILRSLEDAEHR